MNKVAVIEIRITEEGVDKAMTTVEEIVIEVIPLALVGIVCMF